MKLIYYNKIKSCDLKKVILPISTLDMRKLINGLYVSERVLFIQRTFSLYQWFQFNKIRLRYNSHGKWRFYVLLAGR